MQVVTTDQAGSELTISPALPAPDRQGHRPAVATAQALIARTLIRRRTEAGLSRSGLARLAGLSDAALARIESGKHRPARTEIARLESALRKAAS